MKNKTKSELINMAILLNKSSDDADVEKVCEIMDSLESKMTEIEHDELMDKLLSVWFIMPNKQ